MFRIFSLRKSALVCSAALGVYITGAALAQSPPASGETRQSASAARVTAEARNGAPVSAPALSGPAARGEYLATHVAMCVECHSPRDSQGRLVASELFLGAPIPFAYPPAGWATLAPKIARLPGSWSEEEVVRLLQTGQTPNGIPLRKPMPPFRLNREDATAIAAFLKSVTSTR